MPRFLFPALFTLSVSLHAEPTKPAADPPELKAAAQALKDQLPEVALLKLEKAMAMPNLSAELQATIKLRLAEAAVRADKPERALQVIGNVDIPTQPELAFWKAAALQSQHHFHDAAEIYQALPEKSSWPLASEAAFNAAATLSAIGDYPAAQQALTPLLKSGEQELLSRARLWNAELLLRQRQFSEAASALSYLTNLPPALASQKEYLQGKLELETGKLPEAIARFTQLTQRNKVLGRELYHSAALSLARAQRLSGDKISAGHTLAAVINESPEAEILKSAFAEVVLCNTPPNADPELNKLLATWTASTSSPTLNAEAWAALIASREASGQTAEALDYCNKFLSTHADSPVTPRILLLQSKLLISQGKGEQALQLIEPLKRPSQPASIRAWAAEVTAYASLHENNFAKAASALTTSAQIVDDPERKLIATYHAALAALLANDFTQASSIINGVPAGAGEQMQADLQLEQGLYSAAQGRDQAESLLETFLSANNDHPRAFEAALALAEVRLKKVATSTESMNEAISAAQKLAVTPAQQERLQLFIIHLASLSSTPEALALKIDAFLLAYPDSDSRAELLMKLGEQYHNAQQFPPAKARFLQLVEEEPESSLVEFALFRAGMAALNSLTKGCEEEALKLWDKVAQLKGPLRLRARLEQGRLDQRRDPTAALQIFDSILKAEPPADSEMRYNVLCLRGETLIATESENPAKLQEALNGFDQIITSPQASILWKQQALVRKGACLENMKQDAKALEAYHDAMELPLSTQSVSGEVDYKWFFRAGEKSIRVLETSANWKGAVSIAERLGEAPGAQGDSAREKANRLKTEHFLWDDP